MNSIEKLTNIFKRFPGIGPRQARRFVYFLLAQNRVYIDELLREIETLRSQTTQCTECNIFFTKDNFSEMCDRCTRSDTDKSLLMIVAKDVDVEAVKRANVYNGLFFIIGGTLPFLEKNPSEFIRDRELIARITRDSEILKEIIFALPVTPEGDNTRRHLIDSIKSPDIRISTFGRGLSTGTEIEYSDSDTIKSAFNNRA